jgi:ABC-2 type transport system permease protein
MRNILAITTKELKTFFASPMAYVIAATFLMINGFFFAQDLLVVQLARMDGFFGPGSFLLLLIGPILTMRLLAEEQKLGTLELLLTAPVRDEEVVLGKFLSVMGILLVMLLLTFYFPLLLLLFSEPDFGPILTGYLGMFLLSSCFLAVGLLASSLTSNQIVAAVLGVGVLLLFWLLGGASSFLESIPAAQAVVEYLSLSTHFGDFQRGVIDSRGVLYYVTFTAAALFLAMRSVEMRRWR